MCGSVAVQTHQASTVYKSEFERRQLRMAFNGLYIFVVG